MEYTYYVCCLFLGHLCHVCLCFPYLLANHKYEAKVQFQWPDINESIFIGENFNYAGVCLILVVITTVTFWIGWGRFHYEGPKAMSDEIDDNAT